MIRKIELLDIPFIIDCLKALRIESPIYNDYIEDEEFVRAVATEMIPNPAFIGFISEGKGLIMGWVSKQWFSNNIEAVEQLLYVAPNYRGSICAYRLIRQFENTARELNATHIHAGESTGIARDNTRSLYERLGYSFKGTTFTKRIK